MKFYLSLFLLTIYWITEPTLVYPSTKPISQFTSIHCEDKTCVLRGGPNVN